LVRKGLPHSDSKGVSHCLPGVFLSLMKATGRSLVLGEWVFCANLARCLFKSLFVFATILDDWGCQAQWRWYFMASVLESP
jgi:hypothetical protein